MGLKGKIAYIRERVPHFTYKLAFQNNKIFCFSSLLILS